METDARKTRPTHDRAVFKPQIIERLQRGESLDELCAALRLGRATVWRWTESDPEFNVAFRKAQHDGARVVHAPLDDTAVADLAYTAGFFDGEGCIRIQRGAIQKSGARYYFPVVLLSNTDLPAIERLGQRWPGNFGAIKRNARNPNACDIYRWQRSGVAAEVFLRDIYPYIRIKRPQADLVFEFLALAGDRRRNRSRTPEDDARMIDFYVRMTLLNHRGLAPPKIRTD